MLRDVGEGAAVVGLALLQLRLEDGDFSVEATDITLQGVGLRLNAVHQALVVVDLGIENGEVVHLRPHVSPIGTQELLTFVNFLLECCALCLHLLHLLAILGGYVRAQEQQAEQQGHTAEPSMGGGA